MNATPDDITDFAARRDKEQRRHHARKPKNIRDVMAQLITLRGYGRFQADAALAEAWAAAAGVALARFSRAGQIRPYPTWGRLADRQPHQLAHDAGSTIGGSGGPMFSMSGRVIGVNNAVSRDFDSAGLGVPIHEAKVPLAQARRPRG